MSIPQFSITPNIGNSPSSNFNRLPNLSFRGSQTPNPKDNLQQKLRTIVKHNSKYFSQKLQVADVKKPAIYQPRMPSKTGISQYSRKFMTNSLELDLANSYPKVDHSGNRMKMCPTNITDFRSNYRYTYSVDYDKSQRIATVPSLPKNNISIQFQKNVLNPQTTYKRQFKQQSIEKAQPIKKQGSIQLGGKFNNETTYKKSYLKQKGNSIPLTPIIQKQHKVIVGINNPFQSEYQSSYIKQQAMAKQIPHIPFGKSIQTKGLKMRTQYSSAYIEQTLKPRQDNQTMSEREAEQYLMNIVNK